MSHYSCPSRALFGMCQYGVTDAALHVLSRPLLDVFMCERLTAPESIIIIYHSLGPMVINLAIISISNAAGFKILSWICDESDY